MIENTRKEGESFFRQGLFQRAFSRFFSRAETRRASVSCCCLFCAALFAILNVFPAGAQIGEVLKQDEGLPWRIEADQVRYDQQTDRYYAEGDVLISRGMVKLSADRVSFDQRSMMAFAEGDVMLVSGKDVLTGKRMEVDLNREMGTVYDGTIFIEQNHFYIRGDRLEKTGEATYHAERASLTSCDGDSPAWKIVARDVDVTVEGYGTAKHARLYARKLPVFYSPYLAFPVKLKRQTGLLAPRFGYSSRKGVEYDQPFFWAIDDNSDATFHAHIMGKRGLLVGGEYRYMLQGESQGAAMFDVLDDRKVDDGQGNNSDYWGYDNDKYLRPNQDRYWFRMKHDQQLPEDFFARLDLDIVSDQDYLREFKSSFGGFDDADEYFLREFGRDLDEYDDPVRVNSLNISKYWNLYSLNAEGRWYDDVNKRRHSDTDDTLQKLPYVSFAGLRQPVLDSPFVFDLESEYTYYFREDSFTGHRADIAPRLYLPLKFLDVLAVEPSVGVRETVWHIDDWDDYEEDETSFSRELLDARLDLSTELARAYQVDSESTDSVKHSIRPQIVYEYVTPSNQDDLPEFDEIDRIDRASIVTYSITNTISTRYKLPERTAEPGAGTDGGTDAAPAATYGYQPIGRFKIEQGYDFNETEQDRPFTPITAKLDFAVARRLVLESDVSWNTYDNWFERYSTAVKAWDERGDRIFVEHRYTRDRSESLYGDLILKLHERVSMFGEYERDVKDNETVLYGMGLLYMASCWSLDFGYSREEDDIQYAVSINLYGLGTLGRKYAGREIANPFEFH